MQHYTEAFPTAERLHDVLVWALVAERLTDQEVEAIEERRYNAARMAEYQQWLVDVRLRLREEERRRDEERATRNELYSRWWEWLRELELAGQLDEAIGFEAWAARYRPSKPALKQEVKWG